MSINVSTAMFLMEGSKTPFDSKADPMINYKDEKENQEKYPYMQRCTQVDRAAKESLFCFTDPLKIELSEDSLSPLSQTHLVITVADSEFYQPKMCTIPVSHTTSRLLRNLLDGIVAQLKTVDEQIVSGSASDRKKLFTDYNRLKQYAYFILKLMNSVYYQLGNTMTDDKVSQFDMALNMRERTLQMIDWHQFAETVASNRQTLTAAAATPSLLMVSDE